MGGAGSTWEISIVLLNFAMDLKLLLKIKFINCLRGGELKQNKWDLSELYFHSFTEHLLIENLPVPGMDIHK